MAATNKPSFQQSGLRYMMLVEIVWDGNVRARTATIPTNSSNVKIRENVHCRFITQEEVTGLNSRITMMLD